ncbi:Uncharacterized protein DBV15_00610 [Temnothorax longispinosus]|uniref:Uncharacterized protein n=1 Tax=Temnothorax longispinosus TaxID=300112 RepID=A0A4V3SBI5_9HYME|nr:Uncharacterized protein DBV15_00610 [Temnothorax longispinosus]
MALRYVDSIAYQSDAREPHCLTRQSDKGAPGPRAPQALRPRECPGAQDHPDRTYMPDGDLIDSIPVC